MQLPVYVINLDRRTDRLKAITANMGRIGLSFERISAIDARQLPATTPVSPFMNLTSTACLLSHSKALRTFLASPCNAAFVLEDDIEVALDLPALMQSTDWWPDGACLLKLDIPSRRRCLQGPLCGQTPSGRDLQSVVRWNAGAAAYLLNRDAAAVVLAAYKKPVLGTDRTMFDPRISKTARQLKPLQVVPAMARQQKELFGSDIATRGPKRPWSRKKRYMLLHRNWPYQALLILWWLTGKARRQLVPYSDTPNSNRRNPA